ncbi:MAG: tRNA (adenosine(37)-N6)-threonylcarbamoyltransferase complex ATPase subunit type 1 TsaE [Candidatus Endonucleobacter sp. (ex Gigantidas childressi)]|nr:tRNA (adenosine(37)-N6)-threonylcarbamoyltransferase complex ATPase subunit type 1 TsaE [Candidatus Endonucleobacter sp. (ex Gigantidas childressi)]
MVPKVSESTDKEQWSGVLFTLCNDNGYSDQVEILMQSRNELLINNEKDMVLLGKVLAKVSNGKGVVFLHGDCGTGKTTFCRGVITALGHKGVVKSPTYTLVEPYCVNNQNIYHFDLYRLADPEELEFIGGRDYFERDSLCLVEWPSRGEGALPNADIEITFEYNLLGRKVKFMGVTKWGQLAVKGMVVGFLEIREAKR